MNETTAREPKTPPALRRLLAAAIESLPAGGYFKADVFRLRCDETGRDLALKTYSLRPRRLQRWLGRWQIGREARAYANLSGWGGAPELVGRPDPSSLLIEWVQGQEFAQVLAGGAGIDPRILDQADALLAGTHLRGVALGDVHHRNLVVTSKNAVKFIDFAGAMALPAGAGRLRRRLFERLKLHDQIGLAKLRARVHQRSVVAAIAALGPQAIRSYRFQRRAKFLWDLLRGKRPIYKEYMHR